MAGFASPSVRSLRAQVVFCPPEARRRYLHALEDLLAEIVPAETYAGRYVALRVTGFADPDDDGALVPGDALQADLLALVDELSRLVREPAPEAGEPVFDLRTISRDCGICERTVRRWRRQGLPVRWFLFDGRLRLGVRRSVLERFRAAAPRKRVRGAPFSRISPQERRELIECAARLREETGLGISDVARAVAQRLGRAPETVRYTIRRHDRLHPEAALFPPRRARLSTAERDQIARQHDAGVPIADLCRRFGRSRSVIYAAIQSATVARILARKVRYIASPEFETEGAERTILGTEGLDVRSRVPETSPDETDPDAYHAAVSSIPVLSREAERDLFRRYNYVKYRMARVQAQSRRTGCDAALAEEFRRCERAAEVLRRDLITSNLRLVACVARRHAGPLVAFQDLVGIGALVLLRAVESFNYLRGTKFSTYATWALTKEFARIIPEENYRLATFLTGSEELVRSVGAIDEAPARRETVAEVRHLVHKALGALSALERDVVLARFGIDAFSRPQTLREVGRRHRLTAERIRQIQNAALAKLRGLLDPEAAALLA